MPTTSPVAVDTNGAGTDSPVSGPTVMQIMLKLKKVVANSRANSFSGSAPVCISSQIDSPVATNEPSTTGLRPRRSDRPGSISWPRKPPSPMADITKPICCMSSFR
ncbi:hypothetical protein D3C72_1972110 [compost metagenome]